MGDVGMHVWSRGLHVCACAGNKYRAIVHGHAWVACAEPWPAFEDAQTLWVFEEKKMPQCVYALATVLYWLGLAGQRYVCAYRAALRLDDVHVVSGHQITLGGGI